MSDRAGRMAKSVWVALGTALVLLLSAPDLNAQNNAAREQAKKAEAELKAIQAEIERIRKQVSRDRVERDRLTRELREAETSASNVREALERIRKERQAHTDRRAALAKEKGERQEALSRERVALAAQLRAAYLIGREEPLKLLLNQKDPARAGRMFAYYGYFGRARAEQIQRINEHIQRIEELDAELAAQEERLAALESERRKELQQLEQARARRSAVLAKLRNEVRSREQSLARLKEQQSGLEKLLRELRRAMSRFPVDGTAFGKLRGKLAWPVSGRVVANFGESRAGGVKWDGILVATERGAPVRAVHDGRVVYADWLPGLGLLTIIDHGEGYMSLYGHNDRLYKAAGERVSAGDPIAAAGDSGGRSRPEVYFEIRKGGRPIDPRPWFRTPAP